LLNPKDCNKLVSKNKKCQPTISNGIFLDLGIDDPGLAVSQAKPEVFVLRIEFET
jgi:hypothetical protein